MENSKEIEKDAEKNRTQMKNNVLMVQMLEQTNQQSDKNAKEIRIKNINRYLKSTQDYRSLGLLSLSDYLELHSVNTTSFVSEKECQELDWIETILKYIDNKSETPDKCFPIIEKLLNITSQNDDMRKIVQSKYVKKVVESITSSPQSISSLRCLATLLREFSGTSGVFKNQIYEYCIAIIDEINFDLVNMAGICLNLLQQTRGGEIGGAAHQRNWAEFHEKLLNSLNEQFIILLSTGEDLKAGKSEKLKIPEFKKQKDIPLIYIQQEQFIRFKNICIILEATLTQSFPSSKIIQMNRIITFIDKRTSYNQAQINKKNGESHVPYILHIEIQKCLLNLLKAMIIAVNSNILLHSKDVCDVLWKCLKSTNIAYDESKISGNLSLRNAIYDVLIEFLKISPNNHFVYKSAENFIKEALLDITPLQTEVILTLPNAQSKAKKKKGGENKKTLTKGFVDNCLKLHQKICSKSLEFLSHLIMYNGAAMKSVLYKILQDKVLSISFKTLSKTLTKLDLYDSNECRMHLLELNYRLITHSSSRNATPMSFSIEIFKKFKDHDQDPKIRQKAFELIKNVEAILHNRKDPIHFPPDMKDFRDTWLFNEKIVKSFEQIDNEKYQQYEKVYTSISNGNADINIKSNGNSTDEPELIEEEEICEAVVEKVSNTDEVSNDEKEKSIEENSESEDEEMIEEVKETPIKRKSLIKSSENPPKKILKQQSPAKMSNIVATSNENEEDIVNSYLEDFCGEAL
ncbi:hypothetical protein PVAND_000742 [Polypedilum vanderplanki]|uniref:Uncharacterized protein n=1 Tax=Polypedilum vanderplanki TaxID=319348 RepID=A0A9J6BL92_POLVA|nr:hypothetical protein PVAND_000742 [Polypedilum vanderplanki]